MITSTGWMDHGACHNSGDLHFPAGYSEGFLLQIAEAKSVCGGCPVQMECREYGMSEPDGIFGGLTPEERRLVRLRKRVRFSKCQICEVGLAHTSEESVVPEGYRRHYGRGLCERCYRIDAPVRREQERAA